MCCSGRPGCMHRTSLDSGKCPGPVLHPAPGPLIYIYLIYLSQLRKGQILNYIKIPDSSTWMRCCSLHLSHLSCVYSSVRVPASRQTCLRTPPPAGPPPQHNCVVVSRYRNWAKGPWHRKQLKIYSLLTIAQWQWMILADWLNINESRKLMPGSEASHRISPAKCLQICEILGSLHIAAILVYITACYSESRQLIKVNHTQRRCPHWRQAVIY